MSDGKPYNFKCLTVRVKKPAGITLKETLMAAYLSWGYVFPVWMPSTTQTNEIWSKNTGLRQNNNIEVAAHAVTSISFTNPKTFFTKKKWFGFAPYGGAKHAISETWIVEVFWPETLNVKTIFLPSPSSESKT